MDNKILVLGAAFVDITLNVSNLPLSGEDIMGNLVAYNVGGCAFNVYSALRKTNSNSDLFVPIGVGKYATIVKDCFKEKNIDLLIEDTEYDNGWDIGLVEPSGERSFITIPGIEQRWKAEWFNRIALENYAYAYISGYELENKQSAKTIIKKLKELYPAITLLFDASPRIAQLPEETIKYLIDNIDNIIIHCNEDEIKYLSTEYTLENKLRDIYKRTNYPIIITRGRKDTIIYNNFEKVFIKTVKSNVTNTIGAGDTHCGGILCGLQQGLNIYEATQLGNELASIVVSQYTSNLDF